jgi:hypothetical protein
LTTRKADAALTNKGLILLGPAFNAVGNLRLLCGLPDALGWIWFMGTPKAMFSSMVLSARQWLAANER